MPPPIVILTGPLGSGKTTASDPNLTFSSPPGFSCHVFVILAYKI
jgi:hypothetical protein